VTILFGTFSNKFVLTCQYCAELNDSWRACQRLSSSKQGCLLYLIALIAGSFLFLTQFMSSQRLLFLPVISWIFALKNSYLVFLTTFLKVFQSSKCLDNLYFSSSLIYSLFHHNFECLVILTIFECLNQILSVLCVNSYTTCSRSFLLVMCSIFNLLTDLVSSAIKFLSSSLFLTIVCFLVCMCSSKIVMLTMSGAWYDNSLYLGWIMWLPNSTKVS